MFDSPLSASAYEVLGVAATVDEGELRRAFRLRLRETHPDAGGDAAAFIQVQRAWELVGTADARAAYDRGLSSDDEPWARSPAGSGRTGTRPGARSYGVAGAWRRERYVRQARALAGADADVYSTAFVRSAPWPLRRLLADALAEEVTAAAVDELGMGFTAWHGVAAGDTDGADVLDHLVLGPSGLYALTSEDFGGPVRFRRGELIRDGVTGATPVGDLVDRARAVARGAKVRFGGAILILPDDDLAEAATSLGTVRGIPVAVVRRSALRGALRSGIPGARPIGGNELFDVRTRLQQTVRLVTAAEAPL